MEGNAKGLAEMPNGEIFPLDRSLLKNCETEKRGDSIGLLVKDRILCEYDLIASEANFLNRISSTEKKSRQGNQASEAMAEIFNYIENHDDSQFTLKELRDVLTKRYRSERLIDVLYSLVFAASYGKTVKYEISIAYHPQPRILSSESGVLVRYVGDNADINIHTLDDNNTLHVMGMIKIVTPNDVY
ncbi:uncharacterized protein TNIN_52571 [Trichonephila inaurata madagascariensis]|uniref:Uncharacterized protein n=1 Tax=Trichonephila inaurata madagascariensis TaxID=2747483 RepID=A0A8X6XLI8_9ARAC|nr:uncharacterized protein TNIN_52571 [Trichonephila inaurata madagascariensis]